MNTEEIFQEPVDIRDPTRRVKYLDRACTKDCENSMVSAICRTRTAHLTTSSERSRILPASATSVSRTTAARSGIAISRSNGFESSLPYGYTIDLSTAHGSQRIDHERS
jgi:hypothetical protein